MTDLDAAACPEAGAGRRTRPRASLAQERLWLLQRLAPGSAFYNLCWAHRLRGPLDAGALERAVGGVISRHDALRSRFVDVGGVPDVEVAPPGAAAALARGEVTAGGLAQAVDALAREPFDLARGPLVRTTLLRVGPDDHVFVLTAHHTVCDGWSSGVVFAELRELYGQELGRGPADVVPAPRSYNDWADDQRRRADEGAFDPAVAHWCRRLLDAPDEGLPTAEPRPATQSFAGGVVRARIDPDRTAALAALARRERASLFMVLLTQWAALLSRYGAGDTVTVGVPVADRDAPGARDAVGLFTNTVALRCDLAGDPTFAEALARIRSEVLAGLPHQGAPFGQVVQALRPDRSPGRNPLFQHMLVLMNVPDRVLSLPGLEVEPLPVDTGTSQFDLSLDVHPRDGGLLLALEHATDLYDRALATQVLDHFVRLLDAVATDPGARLSELPLVEAGDAARLGAGDLADRPELHAGLRLHDLVEAQVARTPGAVAVVCGDERLTYAELDARACRLAARLRAAGVGPGQAVGVLCGRSLTMAVGMLGVAKAGGAFVPLDPAWPASRVAMVLDDTGAAGVVTAPAWAPSVPGGAVVWLDEPAADGPPPAVACPATTRDLAHVFYTSGSTGRPKGVAVEHRSIVNRVRWAVEAYGIGAGDRILVNSPFTFDVVVWELFAPLFAGGRAIIATDAELASPAAVVAALAAHRITGTEFVPSLLTLCLEEPGIAGCGALRFVLCGSEAMPVTLPAVFHDRLGADLYNVYGPTETAIDSLYWLCERPGPGVPGGSGPVPLGVPIANTTVHVLDRRGRAVPPGVPGEIAIGGVGVARGYLNRPEETAARFVPDPFDPSGRGRLYRTGDLGLRRPDGRLEFRGRIDDQVKVNGVRVEPGEIEDALRRHPAVVDAAVVASEAGGHGGRRLIAFVVGPGVPGAADLRAHLAGLLPPGLVPSSFVARDALPVNGNGKVDRQVLAAEAGRLPARPAGDGAVAPRTPLEARIAALWQEVLAGGPVGVTDNFFQLGGDSILAMQVVVHAETRGLRLAPRDLFEHQTVAELAAHLAAAPGPVAAAGGGPEPAGPGAFALTPAQSWFWAQDFAEPAYFNDAVLLELAPACVPDRLLAALAAVVARHPELGLRFARDPGGEWTQSYADGPPVVPVAHVDLRGLAADDVERVRTDASVAAHRSLDPGAGALGAAALFDHGHRRDLLVVLHHLVVDAVSWRVLLEELRHAHAAGPGGPARRSAPLSRWVGTVGAAVARGALDPDVAFWSTQAGAPLPVDGHGGNTVRDIVLTRLSLGPEDTDRVVRAVPREAGVPVGAVLLTGLLGALEDWRGEPGAVVELEGHGRGEVPGDDVDLSYTVGWFASLFPVRFGEAATLRSVGATLASVPHRGASYGWLRHAHPDPGVRAAVAVPAPELAFNYAGRFDHLAPGAPFRQCPYPPAWLQAPAARRAHLLEINSFVLDHRLHLEWAHGRHRHRAGTVEALAGAMADRLRHLGRHHR
ncbi:MAG TPA: amino acid adenylation domain-containing protein [Acidimicrobiales bacterium]|nr:amino acid adenylation domain-containing protein [Acidimicrobiales bacterium]